MLRKTIKHTMLPLISFLVFAYLIISNDQKKIICFEVLVCQLKIKFVNSAVYYDKHNLIYCKLILITRGWGLL